MTCPSRPSCASAACRVDAHRVTRLASSGTRDRGARCTRVRALGAARSGR
jgi:hypothetical protein